MSKLEELIQQYCPDGVKYKKLGEICNLSRGKVYSKSYIEENAGKYPVYSSQTANNGELGRISTYDYDGEYLTWTTDGAYAGTIFYRKGKFSITNVCGLISTKGDNLNIKFLFYWLSIKAPDYVYRGMGNPKLMSNQMEPIKIPVPPLPVQEEIVRILDSFTELQAELQAELQKRLQQYNYYRDNLLSFEGRTDVEWKKLGEIATLIRGGNFQKKDFTDSGVPCIHYGQIYTHFGIHTTSTLKYISPDVASKSKIAKTNDIVMAITSENVEDVGKCVAWMGDEDIAVSGHTAIIQHKQNAKYLSYYFHTSHFFTQKKRLAHGTKVIEISPKDLANVVIPVPPLAEQQRIVSILDRFDTLTTDITAGLPAEIEARRKQYEYYRDQLLTFKQKA